MKRLLPLTLLVLFCLAEMQAQEEPIPPRRGSSPVRFGLYGGFTPGYLNVDVDPFNAFLKGTGIAPFDKKGVFLWGGAGAVYIMLVPNLRVGGVGMSGSMTTSGSVPISSLSSTVPVVYREAKMQVGFGGVTVEYVFPLSEKFTLAAGAMLGGGGVDLILRQDMGGVNTWEGTRAALSSGIWPPPTLNNIMQTLTGTFFVWVPSLNVEYAVIGWLAVRVGASYVGMSFPSWSLDGNYDLKNVPSDVSGHGLMFNAGILLGTF